MRAKLRRAAALLARENVVHMCRNKRLVPELRVQVFGDKLVDTGFLEIIFSRFPGCVRLAVLDGQGCLAYTSPWTWQFVKVTNVLARPTYSNCN